MKYFFSLIRFPVIALTFIGFVAGCSHAPPPVKHDALQSELNRKNMEIKDLTAEITQKNDELDHIKKALDKQRWSAMAAEQRAAQLAKASPDEPFPLLPPKARSGECYARVFMPPAFRTVTEKVLKNGPSERLEVIPARYEWVEEKVLVKEASQKMEVIPARYEWVEEKVLVKSAATRLETVPARYEMVEEKVLVKKEQTLWKKGRGPMEKVDDTTGEIMCLVEVPASYRTVQKKVMAQPPSTRTVNIPAEYDIVRKRVMVTPPRQRIVQIPATYKTVKVRKMVSPPREHKIAIPAEYQTITRTEMVNDGHMEWRKILCETNVTPEMVKEIQSALMKSGHDPGPIDGVIGHRTGSAIQSYQKEKNLGRGSLTYETIRHLGLQL